MACAGCPEECCYTQFYVYLVSQARIWPAAFCRGAVPGLGAGRRLLCLSIGPHSSPGLREGWRQTVLPAGALPSHLSLLSFLPSSRKRWHLAFMERPRGCVTLTFICHPGCVLPSLWEDDREETKQNPHCLEYLHSHLFTYSYENPFGLWLDMIYCFCDKG